MSDAAHNIDHPMDIDPHTHPVQSPPLQTGGQSQIASTPSPPTSPMAGMRRARVDDDDGDDDDIRERTRPRTDPTIDTHNNTTTNTTTTDNSNDNSQHPPHTPRMHQQRTSMQFLLSLPHQQPFAQFSVVLDTPPTPAPPHHEHMNTHPHPTTQEQQFTFDTGPISRERLTSALALLASRFGAGIVMVPAEHEPDTKRGETILKALEVIPRGLARRMNAVGGVLGSEGQTASEEQVMCPVCWEPLLDEGLFGAESSHETSQDLPEDASLQSEQTKRAILALPCRHIFHGSCLLPWLSRQTTCPSCRFNLDPEHLTQKHPPIFSFPPSPLRPQQSTSEAANSDVQQARDFPQETPVTLDANTMRTEQDFTHRAPLVGAMSMVFSAEPLPSENRNQPSVTSDTPRLDQATQAQNTAQSTTTFPPGFPPELQALLTAMFGENISLVQPGPPPRQSDIHPHSANPHPNTSDTPPPFPSASDTPTPNTAPFASAMPSQTQTQLDNATSVFETEMHESDAHPMPTNPPGIVTAVLGALFGGLVRPRTETRPDGPLNTGSGGPPRPASTPRTAPISSFMFPPPPFRPPFSPFTNGQVSMPPAPPPHLPRPLFMPPFPPNLTTINSIQAQVPHHHPGTPPVTQPQRGEEGNAPRLGYSIPFLPFPTGLGHPPSRERKQWLLPEGRGASIRQRVEEKERLLGLRCFDPSCGFGPTDESPAIAGGKIGRVSILKEGGSGCPACEHAFHSGCLVSAARVAGFGPEGHADGDVEVPCVVCRTHGYVEKEAWEEGVQQLQISDT